MDETLTITGSNQTTLHASQQRQLPFMSLGNGHVATLASKLSSSVVEIVHNDLSGTQCGENLKFLSSSTGTENRRSDVCP